MADKVRVRFAPSPTGPLHIGGVRTALYNYLFAKKHNGDFLLRIEDTDVARYVKGAEEYIIESLKWCGIIYNEGVGIDGSYAPYRQSERKTLYRQYAEQLLNSGHAYYAFDTANELDKLRKEYESRKETFQYNSQTRINLNNSLNSDFQFSETNLQSPYVIRIRIPENEDIRLNDIIRGEVVVHSSQLDDKVLFKSDGMPTYHLANVVDDYLMKITHVIRGEEWLPSAPLHVLLYRYLGWEPCMPQFAHLPLLLKPDGNGKLSKRDGDRLGFPVFPLKWVSPDSNEVFSGYRESGYLPEAFINMLAFLGWNPGTEQEIFSMDELIDTFSFERVGKHGAKFDPDKAKWFNHQYLQKKNDTEIAEFFKPVLHAKNEELKAKGGEGINLSVDYIAKVCALFKERINFTGELWDKSSYMFLAPDSYDEKLKKDKWKPDSHALLKEFADKLSDVVDFSVEGLDKYISDLLSQKGIGKGQLMPLLRLVIIGSNQGPDMNNVIALIGKEVTIKRINKALLELRAES